MKQRADTSSIDLNGELSRQGQMIGGEKKQFRPFLVVVVDIDTAVLAGDGPSIGRTV